MMATSWNSPEATLANALLSHVVVFRISALRRWLARICMVSVHDGWREVMVGLASTMGCLNAMLLERGSVVWYDGR